MIRVAVTPEARAQAQLIREVDREFLAAMDEAGIRLGMPPRPPHDPEWRLKMQRRLAERLRKV